MFSPPPTAWEWLTQFAIPLLAALGSIAVAVAAVVVTVRLDRRNRDDRARAERAELAAAMDDFVATRGEAREALLDAAFGAGETKEITGWLELEVAELITLEHRVERDKKGNPLNQASWAAFRAKEAAIRARIRRWVRTGESGEVNAGGTDD